jgi:hypothetical protein
MTPLAFALLTDLTTPTAFKDVKWRCTRIAT